MNTESIKNNKGKIGKISIIVIFLLMLFAPIIQDIFSIFPEITVDKENRALAKKPKLDINRLDYYPDSLNNYYNDHFAFRGFFLICNNIINTLEKESPSDEVLIGKKGFLYLRRLECAVYEGNDDFNNPEKIQHVADILVKRNEKYKKKGIEYYVVIIPTKYEIYPEYLPIYIQRTDTTSTDKLCYLMQSNPQVKLLYIKDFMLSKKDKGFLYRINDNHWNQFGAYFASDTILNFIKKDFPQIPIYKQVDYQFNNDTTIYGNLSEIIISDYTKKLFRPEIKYSAELIDTLKRAVKGDIAGYTPPKYFSYPDNYEIVNVTNDKSLPKTLIIRDSYTNALMPFLSNSFSKSTYIWDSWKFKDNMEIVDSEKPDIVINIILEPFIVNIGK
ncbi:MAG: DHHW family protein [Bacteroidales bacterium]|jgi:hypothetical protein|nr:DHHW family protein [Bacteroidales bacterium]MDD2205489.1 DHHW family protein [Bacteroidales bacterium]MDD3151561.1 DHHW family protein [Bacteroidales bacterium]MDD3914926.1 DHHW family protein [Bacteroidales bacterium]MDD4634778.1 DHHW family protein [Bacteroidales bacterium]